MSRADRGAPGPTDSQLCDVRGLPSRRRLLADGSEGVSTPLWSSAPSAPFLRSELIVITISHRLAAALVYLDSQPAYGTVVPAAEVRALLVGDQRTPTHVAVPVDEAAWLRRVADAAEVVPAAFGDRDAAVHQLRQVLDARPKAAVR
jgi:hypothetical protein